MESPGAGPAKKSLTVHGAQRQVMAPGRQLMAESDSSWGISAGFKTRPDKGCIFALLDELERNDFNQNKSLAFLQVPNYIFRRHLTNHSPNL
jgi:hypothetical protein